MNLKEDLSKFWTGKKVFITGHTGFKGSWLCRILLLAGAEVEGYSLAPVKEKKYLFESFKPENQIKSTYSDIRDYDNLKKTIHRCNPDIVFHLAAQPIVRMGYERPKETYEVNVMGTLNLLECLRGAKLDVRSVVNITTDKVYENKEWCWPYRETDPLCGFDPYSNSKSCSELVTACYVNSFLKAQGIAVSTTRAGNVIGGGDFAENRIIPDCIRAAIKNQVIMIRHPESVRPYQYVLEPLSAYLLIAERQFMDPSLAGNYNIESYSLDCIKTKALVELFCHYWGEGAHWNCNQSQNNRFHESSQLRLDISKIKQTFGWKPMWNINEAVKKTVDWTKGRMHGQSAEELMDVQIKEFFS